MGTYADDAMDCNFIALSSSSSTIWSVVSSVNLQRKKFLHTHCIIIYIKTYFKLECNISNGTRIRFGGSQSDFETSIYLSIYLKLCLEACRLIVHELTLCPFKKSLAPRKKKLDASTQNKNPPARFPETTALEKNVYAWLQLF